MIKIRNIQELVEYDDGNLVKIRYISKIIEPEYLYKNYEDVISKIKENG